MKNVQPIPKDYGSATPFIIVKGVAEFLAFLKQAFDAKERTQKNLLYSRGKGRV
jgi:hypothetical protein